jgi:hypothetical protein
MDCTKEEFFLLLRNWKSSSRKVMLVLKPGPLEERPLSKTIMARVSGFIAGIDEDEGYFVVATSPDDFSDEDLGDGDLAMIGTGDCGFTWGDEQIISPSVRILNPKQGIEEIVTLNSPTGILIILFALKQPSE